MRVELGTTGIRRGVLRHLMIMAALAGSALAFTAAPAAAAPPTVEEFSRLPAVKSVSLAPDGKHVVAVASPDGKTSMISVWNLDKPEAPPTRITPPPRAQFAGVRFLKNDRLNATVVEPYARGTLKTYIGRSFVMDLDGKNLMTSGGSKDANQSSPNTPAIIDTLPKDPRSYLISDGGEIVKVDAYTGRRTSVLGESERYSAEQTDLTGEVRARQRSGFEDGGVYIAQFIRHPDTKAWEEHFRWYAKNREPMSIVGFSKDPNIAYVITNRGREKSAIFEYDIRARKLLEPAFEHKLFDAGGVIQSDSPADYGEVLGFSYQGAYSEAYWIDPTLKAVEEQAAKALKVRSRSVDWTDIGTGLKSKVSFAEGAKVSLSGSSDDRKRFLIVRSGPNQPPEYYILTDGKMRLLARSRPWIDGASLGDSRLVQYAARDGLMIPAFLTTPSTNLHGPGPYPTIILPHGGPWVRDFMGFDQSGWVGYFASKGYAVLQPQYRGSQGWGQKLWRAGDAEWGQKMQDDKDDGARWLVAQKIAAPDRIAMHGFSYGGYAAMVAAVRPNGLYQCAMAGAGVGNLAVIKRGVFGNRFQREFQAPTIDGLDPLRNVSKVSIPLLLYHGDHDQTVPIRHSEELAAALRGAGKPVTLLTLEGLAHNSGDTPERQQQVLTTLENYLKTNCGPGGL